MAYEWDNKKPTAQMLGRWQPFHDGHYTLFKEIIKKTGQVCIQIRDVQDNFYEATMCVGTFTFGHVKPQALDEFVRITKRGGLICFTINEGIYNDYGFD